MEKREEDSEYKNSTTLRESTNVSDQLAEYRKRQAEKYRQQSEEYIDSDFELAKQLQEEENQRSSEANQPYSCRINRYNTPDVIHQDFDDRMRPPDNYRAERLIPDPLEEEMRRQEFIRQQQLLYAQFQNTGRASQPANGIEQNFEGAQAPLLPRRSVNHLELPAIGRVNREVCSCICLGFLFSVLLTVMILIIVFAK